MRCKICNAPLTDRRAEVKRDRGAQSSRTCNRCLDYLSGKMKFADTEDKPFVTRTRLCLVCGKILSGYNFPVPTMDGKGLEWHGQICFSCNQHRIGAVRYQLNDAIARFFFAYERRKSPAWRLIAKENARKLREILKKVR